MQRYRKTRTSCRLTAAVAAVVFPDEDVPDLEPEALEAYRTANLIEFMGSVAHRTGRSDYMLELRRTIESCPIDALQRCNCNFPDLPRYLGCPCYVSRDKPGCGVFRWI